MLRLTVVKRLAVLVLMASTLPGCGGGTGGPELGAAGSPAPAFTPWQETPSRTGPLEDPSAHASCVESYNSTTIGNRAFAFDGTVVAIRPGTTNKADKGVLDTAAVTFTVNEWFKGGSDDTVNVDLMSPTSNSAGDDTPLYEEGTRLLVSGEPRWGGQPLDDAIAWSCGGFTRYYEPDVADEWRQGTAVRASPE